MVNKVTIKEAIQIKKNRQLVWDYTQNWNNRSDWDAQVLEVLEVRSGPKKYVKAKFLGEHIWDINYQLIKEPEQTSLSMNNDTSKLILGGGGSWRYKSLGKDLTGWIQVNTIILPNNFFFRLFNPIFKYLISYMTRSSMKKAKKYIEAI